MTFKKSMLYAGIVVGAITLAGCGGSSNDSGEGDKLDGDGKLKGNFEGFQHVEAVALKYDSVDRNGESVDIVSYANFGKLLLTYRSYDAAEQLLDDILSLDDVLEDGAHWPGSTACTYGGNIEYSGQRTSKSLSGDLKESSEFYKYIFNDCVLEDNNGHSITVSGPYEHRHLGITTSPNKAITSQNIEIYNLSGSYFNNISDQIESFNLHAQVTETVEGGSIFEDYSIERHMIPFEFRSENSYLALSDMKITRKNKPGTFDPVTKAQSGRIASSWLGGAVVHTTDTPLSNLPNESCPTEGILHFTDDSNGLMEVRYLDGTGTGDNVTVEINQDGHLKKIDDCNKMIPGILRSNVIFTL